MNDPAILFYTSDFLTGTMFFTDEQVGKYIRLLCAQHLTGHLTRQQVLKICLTEDKDILDKFKIDDEGKYYNPRLEEEIIKRRNFSASRAKNRLGKTKAATEPENQTPEPKTTTRKKQVKNTPLTSVKDMGNGNGNGNINGIGIGVGEITGDYDPDASLHTNLKNCYIYEASAREKIVSWDGRKAKAVSVIIDKLRLQYKIKNKALAGLEQPQATDEEIFKAFKYIITNLPDFYAKSYEIADVANGFDRIVNTIKTERRNGGGNGTSNGQAGNNGVGEIFTKFYKRQAGG